MIYINIIFFTASLLMNLLYAQEKKKDFSCEIINQLNEEYNRYNVLLNVYIDILQKEKVNGVIFIEKDIHKMSIKDLIKLHSACNYNITYNVANKDTVKKISVISDLVRERQTDIILSLEYQNIILKEHKSTKMQHFFLSILSNLMVYVLVVKLFRAPQ
jgi:hypothetical protein